LPHIPHDFPTELCIFNLNCGFNGTLKLFTDNVSAELHGKGTLRFQEAGYDICGTWISLEVPIV
jgi:hypothetical protein